MANRRELWEQEKARREAEGEKITVINPFEGIANWWNENIYFHYGKDGPRLDTSEVLKDIALGPTVEWNKTEDGETQIVVTDPLHGEGTEKKQEIIVSADTEKMGNYLFIGGIMLLVGLLISLIFD